MTKEIYFDMDGTLADFYGVENWLEYLEKEDTTPYEIAKPLLNMSVLARYLNKLSRDGWKISIISWGSKNGSADYLRAVEKAKKEWIKKHLKSILFENFYVVPYGTPKEEVCGFSDGFLFDDEKRNCFNWSGLAFGEKKILEILKNLC